MALRVDRVRRHRQAETLLDLRDERSLLPVGIRGASQRDQDLIGIAPRDRVGDDGQDAPAPGGAGGVGADGVHVVEYLGEALVGHVATAIDVIGQPRKSARQRRGDHVNGVGTVDDRAYR